MSSSISAQQKINVSGFIRGKESGERLIGAYITEAGTSNGTTSDYNGYFNIVVKNNPSIKISFIGYENQILNLQISNDTIIEIDLSGIVEQLSEVTVSALRRPRSNIATLNYAQMTQTPSLGGKPDVIRALQLLPGISSQKEGSSLMIVRGGDPGQNLYLFDNVPIIYVNHLGGFMSVFNPEIINNIDVYKGGFPSRYGGRLSSVVDITQREGNDSTYKGSFGIGITDLSFTLEGPAGIKNSSFIVGGRKTLIDPIMALISSSSLTSRDYIIAYGFHDINGKFTWKPDKTNSFSINIYQGSDYLNYWSGRQREKYRMGDIWGNWMVSAKLNSIVSSRLFASANISLTRYRLKEFMKYTLKDQDTTTDFYGSYKSSVRDLSFRSGMKYTASEAWFVDFGLQCSFLSMFPNETYISTLKVQQQTKPVHSFETAIYADNKFILKNNLTITPGIRITSHITSGFSDLSFEPRFHADMQLTKNHSIDLSYMKVAQYSHLVFTTGSIMNNEVWIPSGKKIPPAKSDQLTIGWNGSFLDDRFSSGINFYFKDMYSLSTYRDGYTSLMGDENWITKVETGGKGRSMGIEFQIRKNSGNWTGFISYVHSKTTRQFPNINNGQRFLFDYNRPNNLSLNLNRKINRNLNFNLVWIYQTGLPYTEAVGRRYVPSVTNGLNGEDFYYEGLIYGERNGARMRDYHRLDAGLTWSALNRRNNKVEWNFSVYNLYNRHNPVLYYYNTDNSGDIYKPQLNQDFKPLSLYQLSLFPVIPTLSYKVYFDSDTRKARKEAERVRSHEKPWYTDWLYHRKSATPGQGSYIKNRWNIKAGYSVCKTSSPVSFLPMNNNNYRLELNYGIRNNIEAGIYGGYSRLEIREQLSATTFMGHNAAAFFYGVNCNFHLLPLLIKMDDFRFDLYLTGKMGGLTVGPSKYYEEYCIGSGITFYIFKHLGVFGEYNYGKFFYKDKEKFRYGLSFKFK